MYSGRSAVLVLGVTSSCSGVYHGVAVGPCHVAPLSRVARLLLGPVGQQWPRAKTGATLEGRGGGRGEREDGEG